MSDLRHVPPALAKQPLSAPTWVWLVYGSLVLTLAILSGSVMGFASCIFVAGFSFQFWVYAAWRGLRRSPAPGADA